MHTLQGASQAGSTTFAFSSEQAKVKPADVERPAKATTTAKQAKKLRQKANRQQTQAKVQQAQATPQQTMGQPSLTGPITPSSVLDPDPLKSSSSTPDCQNASDNVKQPIPLQPAPTLQLPSSKATMPEFVTLKVSDTNSPIPVAIKQPNTSSAAQQETAYHTMQHDNPKQSSHSQLINQPNERPASAHPTEVLAECD